MQKRVHLSVVAQGLCDARGCEALCRWQRHAQALHGRRPGRHQERQAEAGVDVVRCEGARGHLGAAGGRIAAVGQQLLG